MCLAMTSAMLSSARKIAEASLPAPAGLPGLVDLEPDRDSRRRRANEAHLHVVHAPAEPRRSTKSPATKLPGGKNPALPALELPDLPELPKIPRAPKLAPSGDSSSGDSTLRAYLGQLRRYPILSRDEEHEIAVEFARTGDLALAARLVTANLRLVVKFAREYRRANQNLLDLIQEGNSGLVVAVHKYDPHRGVKLSSYAAWWIRAYVLNYVLSNCRMVKVATTQAQRRLFFNLDKQRARLERNGAHVDTKQLALALDVSEQQVTDMERRLSPERSLDVPLRGRDNNEIAAGDLVRAALEDGPDAQVERGEFLDILRTKLRTFQTTLTERDLEIFQCRLLTEEPVTSTQVAARFGISRERVRQLEERLRHRAREFLEHELGDALCRA
jgi:RNA polymerase sigma-32 factor